MTKPQLSAFAKVLRKSYSCSRGGTIAAEKMNVIQSPRLQLFTASERSGQPLKGLERRA